MGKYFRLFTSKVGALYEDPKTIHESHLQQQAPLERLVAVVALQRPSAQVAPLTEMAGEDGDAAPLVDLERAEFSVEYVSKALVDMPENVEVKEIVGEQTTVVELKVDKSDLGKVIGKQGRTARALRTILNAASTKLRKRSVLEIIE